jgi:hypothetical protein
MARRAEARERNARLRPAGSGAAAFSRCASEGWWAREDSNLQPSWAKLTRLARALDLHGRLERDQIFAVMAGGVLASPGISYMTKMQQGAAALTTIAGEFRPRPVS